MAVLNRENAYSKSFAAATPAEVLWFSHDDELPGWERARISGDHNRANLAAGILAASRFDIPQGTLERAIATFPGSSVQAGACRGRGGSPLCERLDLHHARRDLGRAIHLATVG